jgi:Ca2+-binding EF-hand superfamily protein
MKFTLDEMIKIVDKNEDGKISYSEFRVFRVNLIKTLEQLTRPRAI